MSKDFSARITRITQIPGEDWKGGLHISAEPNDRKIVTITNYTGLPDGSIVG